MVGYDVVQIVNPFIFPQSFFPNKLFLFIILLLNKKVFLSAYCLERRPKDPNSSSLTNMCSRASITLRSVDFVINQCHDMQVDFCSEMSFPADRCLVIYNPVSEAVRRFKRDVNSGAKANVAGDCQTDYFLWMGRLEKQKDPEAALKSFAVIANEFPSFCLRIVGQGSEQAMLEAKVEELGLQGSVEFRGFVDRPFSEIYGATALLSTSFFEGFPNVILEALFLGTPVIAFDCPTGPGELIIDKVNGHLIKDRSVDDFAKAMVSLARRESINKPVELQAKFSDQEDWYRKITMVLASVDESITR